MKTLAIVSSFIALGSLVAFSQPAAAPRATGQVTIRAVAKTVRPEKKEKEPEGDGKEKPVKNEVVTKNLEINLSGAKTVTGALKMVTTWYGRDAKSKDTVVEKKIESEVTLDAAQTAKLTSEPITFTSTPAHTKKEADGKSVKVEASGHAFYGWVIRVYQGDTLLGEAASAPPLLKLPG